MQAQSWAAHFARGRAEALRSARLARRSALPERHLVACPAVFLPVIPVAYPGAPVVPLGRQHSAEPWGEPRPREAWSEVLPASGGSQRSAPADVPEVASPRRMAVALRRRMEVLVALDATVQPRQPEVVEAAYAMVRLHRAEVTEESRPARVAARYVAPAPRMEEAVAKVVASDAPEEPPRAAVAASGAAGVVPQAEAAAPDAAVLPRAGAAAPHAAVGPAAAVAGRDVAGPRREVAAAQDAAELRQVEVLAAPAVAPSAPPSAAASVFRQGRLRPAAAAAAPQSAARSVQRSVHEKRNLRTASRSARSLQAAQDEVWSWRSRFLESLL